MIERINAELSKSGTSILRGIVAGVIGSIIMIVIGIPLGIIHF